MYQLKPGEKYNQSYLDYVNSGKDDWFGEVASGPESSYISSGSGGISTGSSNAFTGSDYPVFNPPENKPAPPYVGSSFREMPTYTPSSWDDNAITRLTQKKAMPGIRELRSQINRVTGKRYDNPNVGRITLRDALQGYGSGLSSVISGAGTAAIGEYATKFGREAEERRSAYTSEAAKTGAYNEYARDIAKTGYGGAMDEWKTNRISDMETAKMNYGTVADIAKESRTYKLQQKAFEDAWARWKRQQEEKRLNPKWGA